MCVFSFLTVDRPLTDACMCACFVLLRPPCILQVAMEVGERRLVARRPVHVYFGDEVRGPGKEGRKEGRSLYTPRPVAPGVMARTHCVVFIHHALSTNATTKKIKQLTPERVATEFVARKSSDEENVLTEEELEKKAGKEGFSECRVCDGPPSCDCFSFPD